jgi:Leucine-rich repeat (LRR) protein
MKSLKRLVYVVCLSITFISCGGGDSGPSGEPTPSPTPAKVPVTGVTVNKTTVNLMEGATEDISATVTPDNASNKSVSWKSDDPSVVTVSEGKITAVAPGMTTITVTTSDGSKTATVNVTVTMDVSGRQKRALLALFEKTGGTNWTNKTGWNTDSPLKDWYGVKVSGDYVTEIDLTDNNLEGQLPDGLQFLSKLVKLVLAKNKLSGSIPPTWGDMVDPATTKANTRAGEQVPLLSELEVIDLSNNQLSGEIPVSIGNLTTLKTLKLDHNKLTGNLPTSLANLTNLTTLTIAHNELDGELPKEITDSNMWKNIVNKTDLTQDGGKVIVDTSSEGVTVTGGNPGNIN